MQKLDEMKLGRVLQHAEGNKPFAIFTAFRSEKSREENVRNNKEVAYILRAKGYGYFYLDGFWIENKDTPEEVHVSEDSIFVIGDPDKEQELINLVVALGREYNQDAVLIKTSEGVHLYNKAGTKIANLGEFKPNKIGDNYSKLRGRDETFVFECDRGDEGYMAAILRNSNPINESEENLNRLRKLAGITK
jgi:hypothetical protein